MCVFDAQCVNCVLYSTVLSIMYTLMQPSSYRLNAINSGTIGLNAILLQSCIVICLLIFSAHFALAVPVKFNASIYKVCTVRGRPSSVTLALEIMKDHNFDFTVNVITRNGTAMSM